MDLIKRLAIIKKEMKMEVNKVIDYIISIYTLSLLIVSCVSEDSMNSSSWKHYGGEPIFGGFVDFCDTIYYIRNGYLFVRGYKIGECKSIDWNTIEIKVGDEYSEYTFYGKCE